MLGQKGKSVSKNYTLFASVVCDKYYKLSFKLNHFKLLSMVFKKYMNLILYCRNNKSLKELIIR